MAESVASTRATDEEMKEGEIDIEEVHVVNATDHLQEIMVTEGLTWSECVMIGLFITLCTVMVYKVIKWMMNKAKDYMDRWYVSGMGQTGRRM